MGNYWFLAAGAAVCVILLAAHYLRRRRARRDEDEPLISLVLLLRDPRSLDKAGLSAAADRALGVSRTLELPSPADFLPGAPPSLLCVQAGGFTFGVLSVSAPYVADVQTVAETIPDLRLRKAFAEHRAWLAVDLLEVAPHSDLREPYRYIGKLVAELAGEDCLAIFAPATDRMNVVDAELIARLRGPDPLEAVAELTQPPVIAIPDDDRRMQAAVREAKARWPEFLAAFAHRRDDQHFAVKVPFTEGEDTEYLWVNVTGIEGSTIRGTLGNEPVDLAGVHMADPVEVRLEDLNDWAYGDGENLRGGFTMKVLLEARERRR